MFELITLPILAAAPAGEHLSWWAVTMLIFSCLVLYGGFFWCTSIAWQNRHKHRLDDEEEQEIHVSAWDE